MTKTKGLDVNEDFETPTRKLVDENSTMETAVRKGFALATFVKVIFERNKEDVAFVLFEISLPLVEEHQKWCPSEINDAWEVIKMHSGYTIKDIPVEAQVVDIQIAPDAKDGAIKIDLGEIEKASIEVITEKGTGEEREVTRLQFRIRTELDNDTGRFARVHFGHPVWLKMEPLQRKLLK